MLSKKYLSFIRNLNSAKKILESNKFLVQGEKSVLQVLKSNWKVESILCSEKFFENHKSLIFPKAESYFLLSKEQLSSIGNFVSNNSVIAIVKSKKFFPQNNLNSKIILDEINDPGNLGTIIRIADWFGIKEIVCSEKTVFFYNSKVLQASMGSFLSVEVSYTNLKNYLPTLKIPIYSADLHGESIHKCNLSNPAAIIFGSESHGISKELKSFISKTITIPSNKNSFAESLNVGVAAGIICAKIFS